MKAAHGQALIVATIYALFLRSTRFSFALRTLRQTILPTALRVSYRIFHRRSGSSILVKHHKSNRLHNDRGFSFPETPRGA